MTPDYKNGIRKCCRTCGNDAIHHEQNLYGNRDCGRCGNYNQWVWDGETYGHKEV